MFLPILGAAIGGIASLAGGAMANNENKNINTANNAFNAAEAEKNRAFQTEMSNTSYQRASADMQKAGLNPMLGLMNSGGASQPSGSAASASSPARIENVVAPAVSSAIQSAQTIPQIQNLLEQNKNVQSDTAQKTAQTIKTIAETKNTGHTGKQIQKQTELLEAQKKQLLTNLPKLETDSIIHKNVNEFLNKAQSTISNAAKTMHNTTQRSNYNKPPGYSKGSY